MKCIQGIRLIELKGAFRSFDIRKHILEVLLSISHGDVYLVALQSQHRLFKGCAVGQVLSLTTIQAILHLSYYIPAPSPIYTNHMPLAHRWVGSTASFLSK